MDIMETIKDQITNNRVLLYMKGSPNQPQCGFSARAVQALASVGERFAYVDILSNPEIRSHLPIYANWPTFPQLWVDGELVGGCDIIAEMETEIATLSVGEAVMRMDLANAPVVMFRNSVSGGFNVVYRRADGNIGWIDPANSS